MLSMKRENYYIDINKQLCETRNPSEFWFLINKFYNKKAQRKHTPIDVAYQQLQKNLQSKHITNPI